MENAVKALYIAAGVLIAVLVLSLAVVVYSSLQSYVENSNEQIKDNDLNSFNSKYLNYAGRDDITIQDIVTIASFAYENNMSYDINPSQWPDMDEKTLYVTVYIDVIRIDTEINENIIDLLEEHKGKKFKCEKDDVYISETTGQVSCIIFREL